MNRWRLALPSNVAPFQLSQSIAPPCCQAPRLLMPRPLQMSQLTNLTTWTSRCSIPPLPIGRRLVLGAGANEVHTTKGRRAYFPSSHITVPGRDKAVVWLGGAFANDMRTALWGRKYCEIQVEGPRGGNLAEPTPWRRDDCRWHTSDITRKKGGLRSSSPK